MFIFGELWNVDRFLEKVQSLESTESYLRDPVSLMQLLGAVLVES